MRLPAEMNTPNTDAARTWVKVPENKRNPLRLAQNLLYPIALLRPTYSTGDLRVEARRLEQFRVAGVAVPPVLVSSRKVLVTGDVGPSIEKQLKDEPTRAGELIKAAFEALLGLHMRKLVHGRPFLRDMTLSGGRVYFLDLEEDPLQVMPLSTAQVRDFLLMVFCMNRLGFGGRGEAVQAYLRGRDARFHAHLEKQLKLLSVLTAPLCLVPSMLAGKDLRTVRGTLRDAFAGLAAVRLAQGAVVQGAQVHRMKA